MSEPTLLKFKLMRPGAIVPSRATDGSGAFDFYAPEDGFLDPGEKQLIPSGVAHDMPGLMRVPIMIPPGYGTVLDMEAMTAGFIPVKLQGILFDRSGLGGKKGIRLSFNGLIDNDYRGEILLSIINDSPNPFSWKQGDRLCQLGYTLMYASNAFETAVLSESNRGAGGFGSTGK